ncbi:hypothetical protein GIB67_023642 [Kingdonia uniflora]|uniref:Uncharacterized protein n=1 Tax=Kingdonia uniflora TaxID=39325 RepID=A0A7J7L570_9MAGN|nr:hypothetical protein GIB67_023642 [Kingdonia uniflora]
MALNKDKVKLSQSHQIKSLKLPLFERGMQRNECILITMFSWIPIKRKPQPQKFLRQPRKPQAWRQLMLNNNVNLEMISILYIHVVRILVFCERN